MDRRVPSSKEKWDVKDVELALRLHYLSDVYRAISIKEVELEPHHDDVAYCRRADMMTIFAHGIHRNCKLAKRNYHAGHERPFRSFPAGWRVGWEFKTNRNDLLLDVKQRWKQNPLQRLTNEMYLVIPRGIIPWSKRTDYHGREYEITDMQIPSNWGVVEVYKDTRLRWKDKFRAEIKRMSAVNYSPELPLWFLSRILLNRNHLISDGEKPGNDESP